MNMGQGRFYAMKAFEFHTFWYNACLRVVKNTYFNL